MPFCDTPPQIPWLFKKRLSRPCIYKTLHSEGPLASSQLWLPTWWGITRLSSPSLSLSEHPSNWTQIWFNIFEYLWNPFTPTSAVLLNFLLSEILLISILLGVRGRGFLYAGTQFDGKKKSFYQTSQVNLGSRYDVKSNNLKETNYIRKKLAFESHTDT